MSLTALQTRIDILKGRKQEISSRIKENEVEVRLLTKEKMKIAKCMKLLSYVSQFNQEKIVKLLKHTVSAGLKDLFDSSYEFDFELKTRGDSSACEFNIKHSTFPGWSNIVMSNGRSIQEIVAMILRLIIVKLTKDNRKIVILDEPSGGVESERQPLASKFFADICQKFDIQLIIVTHNAEFLEHAKNVINLDKLKC